MLLNLRGNDQVEDVDKVLKFVDTSVQLAKDDFKATTETSTRSLYEAHQTLPELLGTVLEKKASPDLNKPLANYYKVVIQPVAEKTVQEINAQLEPKDWIDLKPEFLPEEQTERSSEI